MLALCINYFTTFENFIGSVMKIYIWNNRQSKIEERGPYIIFSDFFS